MLLQSRKDISSGKAEFQWAPTLGGECYHTDCSAVVLNPATAFQWAPTLGGECYFAWFWVLNANPTRFNGHPPLGVNATHLRNFFRRDCPHQFQWAPTLGGECYRSPCPCPLRGLLHRFQWAPTLGGECYQYEMTIYCPESGTRFNGHPPLGVNATVRRTSTSRGVSIRFNGHPPLGVNATDDPADWFESSEE